MKSRYIILTVSLAIVGASRPVMGGPLPVMEGVDGPVPMRAQFTLTNNTGQDVNDVKFDIRNKEPFIDQTGARANAGGPFQDAVIQRISNNIHRFTFDAGVVPNGGPANFDIDIWLNRKNALYVENAEWTVNGQGVGQAAPNGGFQIGAARPGGNGGNNNIGGGGQGGQEGGGGSEFFIHDIIIENDEDKPVTLITFSLLASMTFYEDLVNDIPWNMVDPVDIGTPLIIPPLSSLIYRFNTTGSYLGGHVYLTYQLNDPFKITADHPVTEVIPESTTILIISIGLIGLAGVRMQFSKSDQRSRSQNS